MGRPTSLAGHAHPHLARASVATRPAARPRATGAPPNRCFVIVSRSPRSACRTRRESTFDLLVGCVRQVGPGYVRCFEGSYPAPARGFWRGAPLGVRSGKRPSPVRGATTRAHPRYKCPGASNIVTDIAREGAPIATTRPPTAGPRTPTRRPAPAAKLSLPTSGG